MRIAEVIDFTDRHRRRQRQQSFERMQAAAAVPQRTPAATLTWQGEPLGSPRLFGAYDQVADRCSGRRGLVLEVIGSDRYRVMFFIGRNCEVWHADCWGYQLRLLRTADQLRHRIVAMIEAPDDPESPPSPA